MPMTAKHPFFFKSVEFHGQPLTVPIKIYRPYIFSDGFPVGVGLPSLRYGLPVNVEPYTVGLVGLLRRDWEAILGVLTRTARNLLFSAMRNMTDESSVQDLIIEVERLAVEKKIEFTPDIMGLRKDI